MHQLTLVDPTYAPSPTPKKQNKMDANLRLIVYSDWESRTRLDRIQSHHINANTNYLYREEQFQSKEEERWATIGNTWKLPGIKSELLPMIEQQFMQAVPLNQYTLVKFLNMKQ